MREDQKSSTSINIELQLIQSKTSQDFSIPSIDPVLTMCNKSGYFLIQPLLKFISDSYQNLEHTMVLLFSSPEKAFIYFGNYPLASDIQISANDFISNSNMKIRCRCTRDYESAKTAQEVEEENASNNRTKRNKRTKERLIGEIMEKVAQWKNLYTKVQNFNGEIVSLTREEAANRVGISIKSLDDYLLHLRKGRKNGFNFDAHQNEKTGLLRAFNKKIESIRSELGKLEPGEPIPSELEQRINDKCTSECKFNKCCLPHYVVVNVPEQSSN